MVVEKVLAGNYTGKKDYSEYWGVQVLLIRTFQHAGIRVDVKDRLPIFRLWRIVQTRMVGKRADHILQMLNRLTELRKQGLEPVHKEGKYV